MTDLLTLIESSPLSDCKKEIDSQLQSISNHPNEMKLAVIASFLLTGAMRIIKDIDPEKFLESLKTELEKEIKEAENLLQAQGMYMEHLDKNRELIANFDASVSETGRLSSEINELLDRFDNILKNMAIDRCKKSIAEIESGLN